MFQHFVSLKIFKKPVGYNKAIFKPDLQDAVRILLCLFLIVNTIDEDFFLLVIYIYTFISQQNDTMIINFG